MATSPETTLLTLGHSTLPMEEFLALLRTHGVRLLADIRRYPGSRRYPWFTGDRFRDAVEAAGIAYRHFPDLGGRRTPRKDSPNGAWRSEQFRGYADHMATPAFRSALDALNGLLPEGPVAVMCSEALPWRCHRYLLADAEVARGVPVAHIMGKALRPHALAAFGQVDRGLDPPGVLYPPEAPELAL